MHSPKKITIFTDSDCLMQFNLGLGTRDIFVSEITKVANSHQIIKTDQVISSSRPCSEEAFLNFNVFISSKLVISGTTNLESIQDAVASGMLQFLSVSKMQHQINFNYKKVR